ncbi:hypothetical protein Ddc_24206 [Ditylenchus destructor]|nr:hypothetical protein Ddc_24206 [Ditylenchus destructor]
MAGAPHSIPTAAEVGSDSSTVPIAGEPNNYQHCSRGERGRKQGLQIHTPQATDATLAEMYRCLPRLMAPLPHPHS